MTIYDILSLIGTEGYNNKIIDEYGVTRREYEAVGIDSVTIDGNKFSNYGVYSFIWEKTFVKSPQRSASGNIGNLNSYQTFLTPHLIMDFSIMSIDDYRDIMKLHYEKNEYIVECYDPIFNRKIKAKMYFGTEEAAKLYTINRKRFSNGEWEDWIDLVGVQEYKVELIGTNNSLDLISILYKYNAPYENGFPVYPNGSPMVDQAEEDTYIGEEIVIGANSTFPDNPPSNNYIFKHWTTTADDKAPFYTNGNVLTANVGMTLYAQWQKPEARKLSYNYGLSDPEVKSINQSTGAPIYRYDDAVNEGEAIPTLPTFVKEPTVENANTGEKYPAYENGAWYKLPVKNETYKVKNGESYWLNRDTIIYLLYDKKKFVVSYIVNDPEPAVDPFINISPQSTEYGSTVYLPTLYKPNYVFAGWYLDDKFETAFSGTMPPYPITLYAKWNSE